LISEETSPDAATSSPSSPGASKSVTPTPIEDSVENEVDLSPDENLKVEDYSASAGSLDDEPTLYIDNLKISRSKCIQSSWKTKKKEKMWGKTGTE
jgi:hypothetical protein